MSNKGKKYKLSPQVKTKKEYDDIKRANKKALDKILATPNFMEKLGRKYYGENWMVTLDGAHPARLDRRDENNKKTQKRVKGEDIPYVVRYSQQPIYKIDKENNILEKYESANQWCEVNNEPISKAQSLVKCARGFSNTAYGDMWMFAEDYNKLKKEEK